MAWKKSTTSVDTLIEELKVNLDDSKKGNARVLILGTETPTGFAMRLSIQNPEIVAGVIYNHAIRTGEISQDLTMCEMLIRIATTARQLIEEEVKKRQTQN